MKSYNVHKNQNLFDIAAHVYGNCSMATVLAHINNLSLTAYLESGQVIWLADMPIQPNTVKAIVARNIIPATAAPIDPLRGFGYELFITL